MSPKEKYAERIKENIDIFRCPICHHPLNVLHLKSLVCPNRHTFDVAKQGYVNMMTRPSNSHYDKKLFEARQNIIRKRNVFALLHQKIAHMLQKEVALDASPVILDAGCGEGSHLQKILAMYNYDTTMAIGLDVAKEGILTAAKNYSNVMWLVGDIANPPLADDSCHVILNILSPANYREFKRILTSDGLVIKVVPRSNYLKEIREAFYTDQDKKTYHNDDIVTLFKQHFHLKHRWSVSDRKPLRQTELMKLVQMTPLTWKADKEAFDAFSKEKFTEITIDGDSVIGTHRGHKGGKNNGKHNR